MHLSGQRLVEQPADGGRYVIGERLIGLARVRKSKVKIIHVKTPDDPSHADIHPGLRERPLHACSCSKAIATHTDSAFQKSTLNGSLKTGTEHTTTSAGALRAEFERIREQGYAAPTRHRTGKHLITVADTIGGAIQLCNVAEMSRARQQTRACAPDTGLNPLRENRP